ncbi:MAG: DNA replication/repair protein RecF, partial [Marinirhabdus sp.]
ISPTDGNLIAEGSGTRRKFMDGVIAQSDRGYLQNLISYNKVLAQRNALLKYFAVNSTFSQDTLDVYNAQLVEFGTPIFEKRNAFTSRFKPIFLERYRAISSGNERVCLNYRSQLHDSGLVALLANGLHRDRVLQYSAQGVHKDDLAFEIDGHPIKKFGSQGQQKSFLIALKLAQFDFMKKLKNTTPILLLDDIFDKLDETRVALIVKMVKDENFGQLFITDTHSERTEAVVKKVHQSYKMFPLKG